jgi:large subunit ribosomal protein L3
MPYRKRPGRGSKAYFPKKRAKRIYPRIKTWTQSKESKPLGFAGYKAGMTHVIMADNNPNSRTKGQQISKPVTILECPPISVLGFRCYTGNKSSFDVISEKINKNVSRKIKLSKNPKKVDDQLSKIPKTLSKINLVCYTNPTFKKKPEVFEIALGGNLEDQLKYAKEILGKDIKIVDVFKEGDYIDVVSVSKGHGTQGPVKRFGIALHSRKSQQMQRHTGSLGQNQPGKVRWTVPQAGQLGFQTRTELNKRILKILNGLKLKGGLVNYGDISGECALVEGTVPGPKKRLIRLRFAVRSRKAFPVDVSYISMESKQGL